MATIWSILLLPELSKLPDLSQNQSIFFVNIWKSLLLISWDFVSWQQETIVTCFTTTASLQSLCCWQFYKACSQSKKSSIKNTLHGRTPCFQSKYSWSYLMAQQILIIHFKNPLPFPSILHDISLHDQFILYFKSLSSNT